jgi:hypothetical protein
MVIPMLNLRSPTSAENRCPKVIYQEAFIDAVLMIDRD